MGKFSRAFEAQVGGLGGSIVACSINEPPQVRRATSGNECSVEEHILLIIDNDDIFRQMLQHYLKRRVSAVFTAKNGMEAHNTLKRHHVNVLVCDYDLGKNEVDGVQLIRRLRKTYPCIKRAVICSGTDPQEIRRSRSVDGIMNKTTDLSRLRMLVQQRFY